MSRSTLLLLLGTFLQNLSIDAISVAHRSALSPRGLLINDEVHAEVLWRPHGRRLGDTLEEQQKHRGGGNGNARSSICTLYPLACKAPFSCDQPPSSKTEARRMRKQIATEDGHANLHAWCSSAFRTDYIEYVDQCLQGNAEAAVEAVYRVQKSLQPDGRLLRADADYCDSAGFCSIKEVTANTTLKDAERICDRRYTHAAWTTLGMQDLTSAPRIMTPETAPIWGQLACAMGNFHCDVLYCRAKHCQKNEKNRPW